jgi:DNA repair ATPase RecN
MKVWDGTSPTRPDPLVRKGPDGVDWKTITGELQKLQTFVVNLSDNAKEMPNVVEEVKERAGEIRSLSAKISKLKVPEDVVKRVVAMEDKIEELWRVYSHAQEVLETVGLLQRQLLSLDERIDENIAASERSRVAFENRVANWQRTVSGRTDERLKKLEEDTGTIGLALGIKKLGG